VSEPPPFTPEPSDLPDPLEPAFEPGGFVPADPDEPPPVELWRVVGEVAPWGTLLLLLSWSVVFALLAARGEIGSDAAYVARGANVGTRDAAEVASRLLSSTFLHDGPRHVFFNVLAMLVFGPAVERIFARPSFWIVYAAGGALASLGSVAWGLTSAAGGARVSLGASGAIFALGGALLAGAFRLRARLAPGRARALAAAIMFLALPAFANGFQTRGTDNAAHAAGLAAGLALGAIVPLAGPLAGRPAGWVARGAGVLAGAALALSLARVLRG